jgi:hypothetical protein
MIDWLYRIYLLIKTLLSKKLLYEVIQQTGTEYYGQYESENCTEEVSVMRNIVFTLAAHYPAVYQIQRSKNNPGHGYQHEKIDFIPWVKEYGCKNYR